MSRCPAEATRKIRGLEATLVVAERHSPSSTVAKATGEDRFGHSLSHVCYLRLKEMVQQARRDIEGAAATDDETEGEERLEGVMQLLEEMERVSDVLERELSVRHGISFSRNQTRGGENGKLSSVGVEG